MCFLFFSSYAFLSVHVREVTGVEGGVVSLPCDVSHPIGDAISLLLWFRDDTITPLYRRFMKIVHNPDHVVSHNCLQYNYTDLINFLPCQAYQPNSYWQQDERIERSIMFRYGYWGRRFIRVRDTSYWKNNMFIFNKNSSSSFKFDARSSSFGGNHWADKMLQDRAFLDVSTDPAILNLKILRISDDGFYHCRVDFQKQPTKTTRVHVSVVIPPERVIVYEGIDFGKSVTRVVGPYIEGEMLSLTCVATGGSPPLQVVWFEDTRLLDSTMESDDLQEDYQADNITFLDNGGTNETPKIREDVQMLYAWRHSSGRPYNILSLGPLQRSHLKMLLTCEASNNNITLPSSKVVMLDMNLPPLGIKLNLPPLPLEARKEYEVSCVVFGGRPPPAINWWRDGERIEGGIQTTTTPDGNVTVSVLHLIPSSEDNGVVFMCKAEAESTLTYLEKDVTLTVNYIPKAKARFGASLDSSNIKEGDDVYFECVIDANPKAIRVSWRHNNIPLDHNVTAGVIVSNQSLVLQRVTRNQAGLYTCHAFNILGDGFSNSQRLDVKYSPVCSSNQVTTYAVSRHEDAEVTCKVDANPVKTTFHWTFNNTADTIDVPNGRYTTASSHSVITYTPVTSLDYGTLLCWASNDIGIQREPCLFHIVPAGKPDAPTNCTISRRLRSSIRLTCFPGNNGGFEQAFHLQVTQDEKSLVNMTREKPLFKIENLSQGEKYKLTVTAENERGSSSPIILFGYTRSLHGIIYKDGPSEAEVRDSGNPGNGFIPPNTSSSSSSYSPSSSSSSSSPSSLLEALNFDNLIPVAMGVGAGLLLIIFILVLLITMRVRLFTVFGVSSRNHVMMQSSPQDSLEIPTTKMKHEDRDESYVVEYCARETKIDENEPLETEVVALKENDFSGSVVIADSPAMATTLLPPEHYGLSITKTHIHSLIPRMQYEDFNSSKKSKPSSSPELLQKSVLSISHIHCQNHQPQKKSSTLPRHFPPHCHSHPPKPQQPPCTPPHYHPFHHHPVDICTSGVLQTSSKECCALNQIAKKLSSDRAACTTPPLTRRESSI